MVLENELQLLGPDTGAKGPARQGLHSGEDRDWGRKT